MKILELTNYTAGGCGVGARAMREAKLLAERGYEVQIFSSNLIKGSDGIAPKEENSQGVRIRRFPAKKLGGESFLSWRFEKEALDFRPDVIIAHAYRHLHTTRALSVAKKLGAKIFLVTHAPFARNETRTPMQNLVVSLYDLFIGAPNLKKFDKVIAITKWEMPFLIQLGLSNEEIAYIPNGISKSFFEEASGEENKNELLYIGRVSPIKDIETIIRALPLVRSKAFLRVYGPAEEKYLLKLSNLVKSLNLEKRIEFMTKQYNSEEQIAETDKARIIILASKSEGLPQVLIESLARKKIVIASDNPGNKDIVQEGKNGFIFRKGDEKDLATKIDLVLSLKSKQISEIKNNAKESVKDYAWEKVIAKIVNLI